MGGVQSSVCNESVRNFFQAVPFGSYWNEDFAKWREGIKRGGPND